MKRFFIGKESGANLNRGLEYFAAGIIEDDYVKNGKGSPSGKDYMVAFIDPLYSLKRRCRMDVNDMARELIRIFIEHHHFKICKHQAALEVMNILEKNNLSVSEEIIRATVDCDDAEILKQLNQGAV